MHTDAPVFRAGSGAVVLSLSDGESGVTDCSFISFPSLINTTLSREGTSIPLDVDNTHTIPSATDQDAGVYICTATNEVGSADWIYTGNCGWICTRNRDWIYTWNCEQRTQLNSTDDNRVIMSSSLSTVPCAIILMTCTALVVHVLV